MSRINRIAVNSKAIFLFRTMIVIFFLLTAVLGGENSVISSFQEEPWVITKHQIKLDGNQFEYLAEAGRIAIRDVETGEPHAYMFFVAYRLPSAGKRRPVTFVWNGGPGANSSLLHFFVAGPKRVERNRLVDNIETWLTATDLVFVDPVGCGFSRLTKPEYAPEFYGTLGDTASVCEFVRCWRLLHGTEDSPLILAGESWGAPRAATVAYALEKRGIKVDGLVLISGGVSLNTEYIPAELKEALRVVDMALVALYHNKIPSDVGRTADEVRETVETWARQTYAAALSKVDRLSDLERRSVLAQLSRFTGIPAEEIDHKTLKITPRQFRTGLLKDQGKILQVFDMRQTVQVGAPPVDVELETKAAILSYLRGDLGYRTTLPYIDLEDWDQGFAPSGKYPESVNSRWNYATAEVSPEEMKAILAEAAEHGGGPPRIGPPLPATEEAIALNPSMKVLVASGLYDSYATCTADQETWVRLPLTLQRAIRFKSYAGGHMFYLDPAIRVEFSRDVKDLIREILNQSFSPDISSGSEFHGQANSDSSMMEIVLKPARPDQKGRITHVDITLTITSVDAPAGKPLLRLPFVVSNVDTVAQTMKNFQAKDSQGLLPMEVKDDPPGNSIAYRNWIPARPVKGKLKVNYRATIPIFPPIRSGPPYALSTEGGGFSGAGNCFLLMPVKINPKSLSIRWDLSELGPGCSGTSSFGDGDLIVDDPKAIERLPSAFFMAGPLRRYPEEPRNKGFSSAWLGSPPFDPLPLMIWTEKLYRYYLGFFKVAEEKPYRVFFRYNSINPGGGVGLFNSFVATFDEKTEAESLKLLLSHEMFHTFSPSMNDNQGHGLSPTMWFSEGLAVFYQRLIPLRAELISPNDFLNDLNKTAARYYTNILNDTPNDQIAPRFWEDTRIRVLPYDRGSMYMAVVDGRIRKASGGKRSLDDIILALIERERKGLSNTPETWIELLTKELGAEAKKEYEAMLAGALMLPDSDCFGPCFRRVTKLLRRFELGFDPKVMNESPRIIRGLIPGSEAERAGLRNGDEIVLPVGLDSIQEDQKRTITLQIRRNGKVFSITYLPRGEMVEAYQWERVPGIPDLNCIR